MAVAQDDLEQLDVARRSPPRQPHRADRSGPLEGFNDPATREYRPLIPRSDEPETQAEPESTIAQPPDEASTAQVFRAGTIEAQRRQQQAADTTSGNKTSRRSTQRVQETEVQASSAQEFVEKQYKRGWQIAQEAVEDLVIETFFLLDLVLIPMYFVRWIGGNMMGGLFTISRDIPGLPGISERQKIQIKLIPGYSLADPLDYVRHVKFLLLAVLPLAILGLIVMLLYFLVNWANVTDPTIRGLWGDIIKSFPSLTS